MDYEGIIIRPPSEANSLLLQVTLGCSHNKCTFCGTYREKKFRIKPIELIQKDILEAAAYGYSERVFLCDGDALIIPQARLTEILRMLNTHMQPKRIGTYANAKSILRKTIAELKELKELGLKIIYMGIETGNEELLKKIHKGVDYRQLVDAGRRVKDAGITLSLTVILGLGGKAMSDVHALDTARILTDIDPDFVGALTLMLIPQTSLYEDYQAKRFVLPDKLGFVRELYLIIANAKFTNCYFTSNHASNYLPVKACLPADKEKILMAIGSIINDNDLKYLRPEYLRGL